MIWKLQATYFWINFSRQALVQFPQISTYATKQSAADEKKLERLGSLRLALYSKLNLAMSQPPSDSERRSTSMRVDRRAFVAGLESSSSSSKFNYSETFQGHPSGTIPVADLGTLEVNLIFMLCTVWVQECILCIAERLCKIIEATNFPFILQQDNSFCLLPAPSIRDRKGLSETRETAFAARDDPNNCLG